MRCSIAVDLDEAHLDNESPERLAYLFLNRGTVYH